MLVDDDVELDAAKTLEFLATARKRFAAAAEDEKELRAKFIDDLRFASPDGEDQWDSLVKMQRQQAGRPAMSFPRCHTFVQQVSNEARQNKPQIKFAPRLDADKDTADVFEGLARYIQYESDATVAYETAIEYSAGASFGYYRFLTDYCDDESDDLELKIVPVLDPLTVYGALVPSCFGRKVKYAFVVEDVPKEEYKSQYKDSQLSTLSWTEAEKSGEGWVGSDSVRIAEYWWIEEAKVKGKRKPKVTVKFCKINGSEVLEDSETTWPGSTIPIIPVLGKQMIVNGQAKLFSVIRPQKSAQQLINYSKSRIAETLSTAPVSPFLVVEGQISPTQAAKWENLNKINTPYLEYSSVDVAGRPAPPPARQVYEPPIQSLSAFVAQEVDDMKATTGIFDASLGSRSNETSGQAIAQRKQQTAVSNMHFMDNLERSFRKAGDVIAELIPLIYDTAREVAILGEDEAQKVVKINQQHIDANGKQHHYKMTEGKYVPIVTMGRAFGTKRMETFDAMQQVIQSNPDAFPIVADIFFKNSDMAGADQLAERYKKMLPPQLQGDDQQEQIPPHAQAQMAQMQEQTQQATQIAQQLSQEKQSKMWEHLGKLKEIEAKSQADMALEKLKLESAITVAEIGTKAQNVSERMSALEDMWSQLHSQAHDVAMAQVGHNQAQDMAAQQAGHQQDAQAQQADATSQQSAQDASQSQDAQAQAAQQSQQADQASSSAS